MTLPAGSVLQQRVLYRPPHSNDASWDALLVESDSVAYLLQTTVASAHPVKQHGLAAGKALLESCGFKGEVRLVLLLPPRAFSAFVVPQATASQEKCVCVWTRSTGAPFGQSDTSESTKKVEETLRFLHRRMASTLATSLQAVQFENCALRDLPLDASVEDGVRSVRGACFSRTLPTAVAAPQLVSKSVAALRDCVLLDATLCDDAELAAVFAGNRVLHGCEPAAHCYAGFQFGHFAGQLGDGRALYLGQVRGGCELQLKGAGLTPYSRSADGRAVLRSSVREFLASEAMHALGVPTTRAGTLVVSRGTTVVRDRNYDGNVITEPVAVVLRLAPTFLRFGSFQICMRSGDREGPSVGLDADVLPPLLEHVVRRHFPQHAGIADAQERWLAWFAELVERTAVTAAHWQTVGFCHGVLNTDNLSAIGVTIDYGPFGFMERFNRKYICNTSDNEGRYSYENQPAICKWNLLSLAEGLQNVLPRAALNRIVDERYQTTFDAAYDRLMRRKLGLDDSVDDDDLIIELLDAMEATSSDFTNTFRTLATLDVTDDATFDATLVALLAGCGNAEERAAPFKPAIDDDMLAKYVAVARQHPMMLYMAGKSPQWLELQLERRAKYHEILAAAGAGTADADRSTWRAWLDRYRARLRLASPTPASETARRRAMNAANPKFVLRNWVAERAIRSAEDRHDFALVNRLLAVLERPFEDHGADVEQYAKPAQTCELDSLCVSCSS